MIAVTEAAGIRFGSTVVVMGLGLLGLYGAAIARARGASAVIGIDPDPGRRERAIAFGVTTALAPGPAGSRQGGEPLRAALPAAGADAVIEVCGDPGCVALAVDLLRVGGTCVIAGVVNPGASASLDLNLVLRKCATLRGVHNYHPRHLVEALAFVLANRDRYPFHDLVDGHYPLEQVGQAMDDAAHRRVLRAAIVPFPRSQADE
jgi:threonine dehydrogenase-like Zn-dependent dehydrogenase